MNTALLHKIFKNNYCAITFRSNENYKLYNIKGLLSMGKNCILINQVKYEIKTYETIRSFFTANILISKYIHTANSRVIITV